MQKFFFLFLICSISCNWLNREIQTPTVQPQTENILEENPNTYFITSLPGAVCCAYHPKSKFYFVANAPETKETSTAYISRLTSDGNLDMLAFLVGLRNPTALAVWNDFLYVADQAMLIAFNPYTGTRQETYDLVPFGIQSITQFIVYQDNLYAIDTQGETIWKMTFYPKWNIEKWKVFPNLKSVAIHPHTRSFFAISQTEIVELTQSGNSKPSSYVFNDPRILAFDSLGNLYVLDGNTVFNVNNYGIKSVMLECNDARSLMVQSQNRLLVICCKSKLIGIRLP